MKNLKIILVFTLTTLLHESFADKDDRRDDKKDDKKDDLLGKICPRTPLLNYLGDYTNLWKNIRLCDRVADSKSTIDRDGRLYLSYRAPLRRGDNPSNFDFLFHHF